MNATDFLENEVIDHVLRARAYAMPTQLHIGLFTTAPTDAGGGTEVAGNAYARAQANPGFANWLGTGGETTDVDSAGTGGQSSNANQVDFPEPTGPWGTVTHFAIFDESGNMLFWGALTTSQTIESGNPVFFDPNALTVTVG